MKGYARKNQRRLGVSDNSKRALPVKLKEIELDGDLAGWKLTARINPPLKIIEKIQSMKTVTDLVETLPEIIIDWNFVNEEGEELGKPSPETMRELPIDLLTAIFAKYNEEVLSLSPKSESRSSPQPG
jgi:hypothetical protein